MAESITDEEREKRGAWGRLMAARLILRVELVGRDGTLPEGVEQRIEACTDVKSLLKAAVKAPNLEKLEDFEL